MGDGPAASHVMERSGQRHGVWWLSPAGGVLLVVPATLLLAAATPYRDFVEKWRTPKALGLDFVLLVANGTAAFVLASLIPLLLFRSGLRPNWPAWNPSQTSKLERLATILFRLTMFGYLAFAVIGFARGARPADLINALLGQGGLSVIEAQFEPVAGITTFTQMGIAYAIVATYLLLSTDRGRQRHVTRLAVVFVLTLMRTYYLTERLAIIEVAIPIVAVAATWVCLRVGTRRRLLLQAAPLVLVPVLVLFFAVFEFSRSWTFYRATGQTSFTTFAVDRFGGYYATAYNNGQLLYDYQGIPGRLPYRSVEALWSAPGIEQVGLYDRLERADYPSSENVLSTFGNPEFNNPCGVCDPFVDWGPAGGIVFLASIGLLLGLVYVFYKAASPIGLLVYPALVIGLFELPRYLYWSSGRLLPALVALILAGYWLSRDAPPPPGRVGDRGPRSALVGQP